MKFEIGDSIIVNQGVNVPDYEELEIGGWQGRIIKIDTKSELNNILISIEWDSLTLEQMPSNYIEESEIEGLGWESMTLYASELTKSKPRDTNADMKRMQDKLTDMHIWDSLGEEGRRISKVLVGVNPNDDIKCFDKWLEYLNENLTFPIQSIVSDSESNWIIKCGNKVTIKSILETESIYGVMASIIRNGEKFDFPLCNLTVIDKKKATFQLIRDYSVWFANR
jgi:hypothetical protein